MLIVYEGCDEIVSPPMATSSASLTVSRTIAIDPTDMATDDSNQSFSTSPLSVDSGLECMEPSASSHWQKRFECSDSSTDSTDSGMCSGYVQKITSHQSARRTIFPTQDPEDSEDAEGSDSECDDPVHLPVLFQHHQIEDAADLTPIVDHQEQPSKRCRLEPSPDELVDVRMIDFAHTTFSGYLGDGLVHWGPDNGYLLGLDSLTKILNEINIM